MISDEMRLNAIRLLEFIQEHQIQRLFLPFIALQHLAEVADNSRIWPTGLQDVITAGEQLQTTKHIASFFTHLPNCKLHNHYGPTETHVVTAYTLEGSPETWQTLPPIGKPIANTYAFLLDEKMMPVANGEQGEIYIGGSALARGYINRPELTAERFLKNPFDDKNNSRIYKTGDLGKYLSDGTIEYLGRADNQVKVRGYRIELGEVEVTLSKHPFVTQAAVTVREDEPGDKRLVAYLVLEGGKKLSPGEIRKFISDKLPEYMLPSSFVFLDALPKTPSGKIDRRSLPKPDESRPDIGIPFVAPQTHEEKSIAILWSQLLRIDKVGIDDNFFDLGGNSLLALQSIARLRQEQGMDIPVVKLYQFPTIKGILRSISDSGNKKSSFDKARERLSSNPTKNGNQKSVEDGIAIIGMSGRFPGANTVEEMWNNLLAGKETTSFFSDAEIDPFIDASVTNDPSYVKARGVIQDADKFDAGFFGVNPRLAELMDPQQRIFLEVCWEALENAGYAAANYDGLIGVYSGMGNNTYYTNNVISHKDSIEKVGGFQVMVANEKDYIATRISHFMNLTGPGLSVHTACSTSLTAVAMACQGLWNNQCDMAISGGIAITSPINSGHLYQEGGMFSEDGHTRSFDENARGTVFSDGSGVVILKRYRDAVRNGDTIYAVIRGVGVNNDGSEKASFTAPSVDGQADVIAMAQADANVTPDTISYIETHGTAIPLGDPIEVEALTQAFRGGTDKKQFCAIGSVKSNFGHLTAAAGVAGLIKTALSLQNKIIPASINYEKPNPRIDFANSPFYVNNKLTEWKSDGSPRRAGVSSFGVGGTNVHLVVEEAPEQQDSGISRSKHLLLVSTKGKENLETATENLKNFLVSHDNINLADAAYTLQQGRVSFINRRFVVAESIQDAIKQFDEKSPVKSAARSLDSVANGVAFMFPGQGSQYVNMGSNLYRDEIIFREAVDRCSEILTPYLGLDLKSILYPAKGNEEKAAKQLQDTCYTQPSLFTIGYALSKLWMSWGIQPAALVGHSIGEFAAACIAGVMSLEDALMLVAHRGKMMQALPKGSMLSVRLATNELESYLTNDISIAAINGPSLSVISGNDTAIDKIQKILEEKEIICKKLFTSHAFHSPMMDPIMEPFRELVSKVKLNPPSIPVVSTATSAWLTDEQSTDPGYWSKHLRLPVRFADGIKTIWQQHPNYVLLEMGPRNTASILARQQATDLKKQFAFPSLPDTSENDAEWNTMLFTIGQLWLSGISISWNDFYALES
ncbi:MAG TPA: beta-ketoacyl synthase N-terminal-like domain-containing protein, partial [Bacteroidia bacterium]|nr:beta-ketoacyl synthase N-terminal-like domain-containing protein [Bacteroidia bacterium]